MISSTSIVVTYLMERRTITGAVGSGLFAAGAAATIGGAINGAVVVLIAGVIVAGIGAAIWLALIVSAKSAAKATPIESERRAAFVVAGDDSVLLGNVATVHNADGVRVSGQNAQIIGNHITVTGDGASGVVVGKP